jgi:hypothetical protein
MNTVEKPSVDLASDHCLADETPEDLPFTEAKISGFDGGTRPVIKEPSLYLSIAVVFIATSVCLSKTPTVFWLSLVVMTAVAGMLHVIAERLLFRGKKEFDTFAAPFEGVFVITFGSVLPGVGLLAYGIYSLSTAIHPNVLEELGKMALLLVVPIFNWTVWKAVRKGYLIRPRLTGLMNGLALGLSASWTAIWIRSLFFAHADASCKFGWMLLLCTSPFLLFSAACLSLDLWRKTEASIGRITTTFSVLGSLLSLLFVFTPMARAFFVQSLITDARQGSIAEQTRAIPLLRSLATDEDLQPSKHPVSGFALAALLVPDRGLDAGTDADRNLYFKITGKPYFDDDRKDIIASETEQLRNVVGPKLPGLSLAKSQISGSIDASTLSSSIDWTLTFRNSNSATQEARTEIGLPKGAVVSRATLWINGEPHDGAFASTAKVQEAYQAVVTQQRDPLLVTMSTPDRILVQCFPVPANGGELKIRIGFKVPLETTNGKDCSMQLPKLLVSNFVQPKRHRINLATRDMPVQNIAGIATKKNADGYKLTGIIKTLDRTMTISSVVVQRTAPYREFATPDCYSKGKRFIVEQLKEVTTPAPKHLFVVIDSSASLKSYASQIKQALSSIPPSLKPIVYFAAEPDTENRKEIGIAAKPLEQAQTVIKSEAFVGGLDNGPALREALETAAEEADSAVLWIHGPQPLTQNLSESTAIDLVHHIRLYDLQIANGPDSILQSIQTEDVSNLITCETVSHESVVADVKTLVSGWEHGTKRLSIRRTVSINRPETTIVSDQLASAQVTCLWAKGEVARLLENGQPKQAQELATNYRLVSPVTGAVVLENARDYKSIWLSPDANKVEPTQISGVGGLVGAPVDPRYGQSNEVGQMADFGYDTARDISRMLTAISLLISIFVARSFLRGRRSITRSDVIKAVVLVLAVPSIVHMMGTFMINNFGGLGGGL